MDIEDAAQTQGEEVVEMDIRCGACVRVRGPLRSCAVSPVCSIVELEMRSDEELEDVATRAAMVAAAGERGELMEVDDEDDTEQAIVSAAVVIEPNNPDHEDVVVNYEVASPKLALSCSHTHPHSTHCTHAQVEDDGAASGENDEMIVIDVVPGEGSESGDEDPYSDDDLVSGSAAPAWWR